MARKPATIDVTPTQDEEDSKPAPRGKKNLPAVRSNTAVGPVSNWRDKLMGAVKTSVKAASQGAGAPRISIKNARIMVGDAALKDNELIGLVVAEMYEHAWYASPYDPDNPSSPSCFAFSPDDADWAPHEKSAEPQNDTCKGCPHDEYGTARMGKGKACRNGVKLAILPMAEVDGDLIQSGELYTHTVSVTNVKSWKRYAGHMAQVNEFGYMGALTKISVEPDAKTQHREFFEGVAKTNIPEKLMQYVAQRHEEALALLTQPYAEPSEVEAPAKPARRGTTQRVAPPASRKADKPAVATRAPSRKY